MKLKIRKEQSVVASVLLRKGEQNTHRRKYGGRVWEQRLKEKSLETAPCEHPSHIQSSNLDTIADAGKCFLIGTCYGCLLRGSARA
jgi:hypothetical protein